MEVNRMETDWEQIEYLLMYRDIFSHDFLTEYLPLKLLKQAIQYECRFDKLEKKTLISSFNNLQSQSRSTLVSASHYFGNVRLVSFHVTFLKTCNFELRLFLSLQPFRIISQSSHCVLCNTKFLHQIIFTAHNLHRTLAMTTHPAE